MAEHCYQNTSSDKWKYETLRCTDMIKKGQSLGTKVAFTPTKEEHEKIIFLIKEFKKFGFYVRQREATIDDAPESYVGTYYYAIRNEHERHAAFMTAVSLTRYLCNQDNLLKFHTYYVAFREEGLSFVDSVRLTHAVNCFSGINMLSFNILDLSRPEPDLNSPYRVCGTSIFAKSVDLRAHLTIDEKKAAYENHGKFPFLNEIYNFYNDLAVIKNDIEVRVKEVIKLYKKYTEKLMKWLKERGYNA